MKTFYAQVRFCRQSGDYYPALLSFYASDYTSAAQILSGFSCGFALFSQATCHIESISTNRPLHTSVSLNLGNEINDQELEIFLAKVN